jgi:CHAD domain-containing protein
MQRELILDTDKPIGEALGRAFEAMLDEAKTQARHAIEAPATAMHDYRRALRRAEAVLTLSWPFLRKEPRRWLARSTRHARRRTRIARDLDAALPVVDKLRELLEDDPSLTAVRTWLESCRSELASDEIVAWRLRKNVRALAGLGEIFGTAMHAWVDIELTLESLRQSYRDARRAFKTAGSRRIQDVHALRRAVRRLRYQLELLASAKVAADQGDAMPAWLDTVSDLHRTMKALARDIGEITDLHALRDIVDEAEGTEGFDAERLHAILSELIEGRIERVMGDAARAFEVPPKQLFATPE